MNLFKGMYNGVVGIIEGRVNGFIGIINGFIRGINSVIGAINGIPGVELGLLGEMESVSIPRLAKGGLAYQPTLAMVGDNKNARTDPEVISPLSKLQGIISQSGGNGNDRIYELLMKIYELLRQLDLVAQFNIDGRMLEEVIIQLMNKNSFITNGR